MKKSVLLVFVVLLFGISYISAECCEKLLDGGWCQEGTSNLCNPDYQILPTSCSQTSYCESGTCVDLEEGVCTPNTPRSSCEESGGYWDAKDRTELPQCQYGCCFLGEDTTYTTQSKCIILASENNIEANYKSNINDEMTCLSLSGSDEKGACVLEGKDLNRDCRMTTKSECSSYESSSAYESVSFNEGYLCTAEFLGNICEKRKETTCSDKGIAVYYKDSCGNLANIYDSEKYNDPDYWTYLYDVEDVCGYGDTKGNANSPTCGSCDYLFGSKCSPYIRDETSKPIYGESICKDLGCKYKGEIYQHGEKWCDTTNTEGTEGILPGTESYLLKCYDGEVLKEGCSVGNWRLKICLGGVDDDGKKVASCSTNLWQDCLDQTTEEACIDSERRDCKWILGKSTLSYFGVGSTVDQFGNEIQATCVPKYPRALNREDDSINFLDFGYEQVLIPYRFGLLKDRKKYDGDSPSDRAKRLEYCGEKDGTFSSVKEVPECQASDAHSKFPAWKSTRDEICKSLGDTHLTTNYIGDDGAPKETMFYKFVRKSKDVEGELENLE